MLSTAHERRESSLMDLPRMWFLIAAAFLATAFAATTGCSNDETIVAVNVTFKMQIAGVTSLVATITQPGQTPVSASITPATEPIDGGTKIKDMFFERLTLPSTWGNGPALLHVDAKTSAGATVASDETTFDVREDGVVAANITLPPPVPDAGVGAPAEDAGP
jgi:hypothetical protein